MGLLEVIGLVGGVCFAYAALPAAIATIRAGRSIGTPLSLALLILSGTLLMFTYLTLSYGLDWVIAINYSVEALTWAIILYYHFFPRQ